MVSEEEGPQEENVNGSPAVEDTNGSNGVTAVSSTAVSPEPILIPAPVRASVCMQRAMKGHGTKDCPYVLDFTTTVHHAHGVPSTPV